MNLSWLRPRLQNRSRLSSDRAFARRRRASLESLENRVVLSTTTWIGGAGNWSDAAKWDTGVVPTASTPVVINASDQVTVDVNAAAQSITLTDDGSLTISSTATLSIYGNLAATSGTTVIGQAGSTVVLTGGGHNSVNAPGAAFGNLKVQMVETAGLTLQSNLEVKGLFTIDSLGNLKGPGRVLASGDVVTNDTSVGGSGVIAFVGSGSQKLTAGVADAQVPGVLVDKAGVLKIDAGSAKPLGLSGGWTRLNGTVDASGSTIVFTGNDHKTINDGDTQFNDVRINMVETAGLTLQSNLEVKGLFTINSIGYFNSNPGGRVNVYKNVVSNDASVEVVGAGQGIIAFVGNTGQAISGIDGAQLPSIVIAKPAGTLNFPGGNLGITGNWTYESGGVSIPNNSIITFASKSHPTIKAGGKSFKSVIIDSTETSTFDSDGTMIVDGSLTIKQIGRIVPDFEVKGNVVSNDPEVSGPAKIIIVAGGNATALLQGGDFPDGGVVIGKTGSSVNADLTKALTGPLVITGVNQLNGTLRVAGDVITSTTAQTGGSGWIEFVGTGQQWLRTAGDGGRLPNVVINQAGGSLKIDAPAARPLSITNSWTHLAGAVDALTSHVLFISGSSTATVDAVGMWFHDVTIQRGNATLSASQLNVGNNLVLGLAGDGSKPSTINGSISVAGDVHSDNPYVTGSGVITLVGDRNSSVTGLDLPTGGLNIEKGQATNTNVTIRLSQPLDGPLTLNGPKLFIPAVAENNLILNKDLFLRNAAHINRQIQVHGDVETTAAHVQGAGSIRMVGTANTTISGAGDFPNGNKNTAGLIVDKAVGKRVDLASNLTVPSFDVISGTLNLKTFSLTTAGTGTTFFGRVRAAGTLSMQLNASNSTEPRVLLNKDGKTHADGAGVFRLDAGGTIAVTSMSGVPSSRTPTLISANDVVVADGGNVSLPTNWDWDVLTNPDNGSRKILRISR